MKRIMVLILVQLSFFADAQVKDNLISCHFENAPFSALVEEIEKNTHYKFYYVQSWIDSVFVTIDADKQPVETVVAASLQNTSLQFYRYSNKIIITRNTPIIEGIDPDFFNTENGSSENKANYYFEREYISTQQAEGKKQMR